MSGAAVEEASLTMVLTHISVAPQLTAAGASDTACTASVGGSSAHVVHAWMVGEVTSTNLVLPYGVPLDGSARPSIVLRKSGHLAPTCDVFAYYHGYLPAN